MTNKPLTLGLGAAVLLVMAGGEANARVYTITRSSAPPNLHNSDCR